MLPWCYMRVLSVKFEEARSQPRGLVLRQAHGTAFTIGTLFLIL
jgi:hypothetical protein